MSNIQRIEDMKPVEVFKYFKEICSIPHGSGNVEKISNYIVDFAKANNLWCRQDESFNVVIKKAATRGMEDKAPIIIQGHIDMVAVKTADCNKDLESEGLELECADGYLYAKGTSLGADDGIAVAYAMAILASDDIEHPELEVLFTTDEEIGMLGATAMDLSDIKSRVMLNIDSEEEGIFLAGCAGGVQATCRIPVDYEDVEGIVCEVSVLNLTGGHSGVEIICQRANANVLLGRILYKVSKTLGYRLIDANGGEKDNAIAVEATAKVVVEPADAGKLAKMVEELSTAIKSEYETTDPNMVIDVKVGCQESVKAFSVSSTNHVVAALTGFPNGIQKMSNDIQGLVQTSLNLGVLRTVEDEVTMSYSVRSAVGSEKEELVNRLQCLCESLGGRCDLSGDYPAWEYQRESRLREVMVETYESLYGSKPDIQTIHAGLECGIIADKLPGLDCISFGPDIKDIHTVKERLDIASTERTWNLIVEVLKRI